MLASRGEFALMTDSDLSTPIEEFEKLYQEMVCGPCDVAFGSRDLPGSRIDLHQSWFRENAGKTFNRLVRTVTGLPFKDTQCGFKLFRMAVSPRVRGAADRKFRLRRRAPVHCRQVGVRPEGSPGQVASLARYQGPLLERRTTDVPRPFPHPQKLRAGTVQRHPAPAQTSGGDKDAKGGSKRAGEADGNYSRDRQTGQRFDRHRLQRGHLENLLRSGIPVVCLDRRPDGIEGDSVAMDNREGTRKCSSTSFLVGRTRIAIITGPPLKIRESTVGRGDSAGFSP